MSQPDRAVPRNPWPIIRFFAHSRSWASGRRSLALGEKSKSATLRAKECERNRTDCRCRFGISIASCRRSSVLNSFNRGAADLDGFAIANESLLNANGSEWRKRRIIGRIRLRRSAVRFRSLPLISAYSVVKNGWHTDRSSGGHIPYFPVPSVSSVVKTESEMISPLKEFANRI